MKKLLATLMIALLVTALLPTTVFAVTFPDGFGCEFAVLSAPSGSTLGTVSLLTIPAGITSLTLATVSDGTNTYEVVEVSGGAASQCPNLASLNLPNVKVIQADSFSSSQVLNSLTLPKVETIGRAAFHGCTSLTRLELPEATTIGLDAFNTCTSLSTVILPKVTTIGADAFANCCNITTLSIPKVEEIQADAFYVDIAHPYIDKITSLSLSEAMIISNNAFSGRGALVSVTLPKATVISEGAFFNCVGLTTISMPSVISIGYLAFAGCSELTTVDLPKVETIGPSAFVGCSKLTSVSIPKVNTIEGDAFSSCVSLSTLTIWKSAPTVIAGQFPLLPATCNINVPVGASGYGTTPWTQAVLNASLLPVSGTVKNPAGTGIANAMVSVDNTSVFTDASGAYTVYVKPGYSGKITAAKAGFTRGEITVENGSPVSVDNLITISPNVPVTVAGSNRFTVGAAVGNAVFTIGEGIDDFDATTNFDRATLDGNPIDLGSVGTPGVDGSVVDGSIRITINQSKLNSLSVGNHTLLVTLKGGSFAGTTVTFTISVAAAGGGPANPLTGEQAVPSAVWLILCFAAICAALYAVNARKRRNG